MFTVAEVKRYFETLPDNMPASEAIKRLRLLDNEKKDKKYWPMPRERFKK
jgi:hypothetical protein